MNDRPYDDLPDDQDEQVRALLAETRVTDPMPRDVADRLDATLADLASSRAPGAAVGTVRPLRASRRGAWGRGLGAAAAVVIVGGGIAYAANHTHGGGEANSAASGASEGRATTRPTHQAATPSHRVAPQRKSLRELDRNGSVQMAGGAVVTLHTASFGHDVRTLLATTREYAPHASSARQPTPSATPSATATGKVGATDTGAAPGCTDPTAVPSGTLAHDQVLEVRLDGHPATLVVDPPGSSPRTATAYSCDGSSELAHTTLSP